MAANTQKTVFVCSQCGYESKKWMGRCPSCGEWNSFSEEVIREHRGTLGPTSQRGRSPEGPVRLKDVAQEDFSRIKTEIGEFDRVLGGGLVAGSLILIGGDPGIGKSTLLLQAAWHLAEKGKTVLYVSGEESPRQVAMRAARLGVQAENLYLHSETNLDLVLEELRRMKPDFAVIDSIQTMFREDIGSAPGSVTQVRECTALIMQAAKSTGCTVFLVGHVTKAGAIAGPRVLEHMVDTVLYFEGEQEHAYRVLRAVKNRFGSTQEVGLFEMREDGMAEVTDPSEMFLISDRGGEPGSLVTCTIEGSRPVNVEIQGLVAHSAFGNPRRQTNGLDYNRAVLLLAVLEKRAGLRLYDQDVYINVAGGLHLSEPAADLAVAMTVASSCLGRILKEKTAVFGEVGLTGEVRPVRLAEVRLAELARNGYVSVILPRRNLRGIKRPEGLEVIGVSTLIEALGYLSEPEAES